MLRILFLGQFLIVLHVLHAQTTLAYHEFEAENISRIKLIGSFCDVVLSYDDKIRFVGKIQGKGQKGDFEIVSEYTANDVLLIEVKQRGRKLNSLSRASIHLMIPRGVSLTITNSSGDISGNNLLVRLLSLKT